MKFFTIISLLVCTGFAACQNNNGPNKSQDTVMVLPDGDTTTLPAMIVPEDILVSVDTGMVTVAGKQVYNNADLGSQLIDTLNTMYQTMHTLPKHLELRFSDIILMGVRGNVKDVVGEAQKSILSIVANDLYHVSAEKLSREQEDSIRTRYPILFQRF